LVRQSSVPPTRTRQTSTTATKDAIAANDADAARCMPISTEESYERDLD
jgi:hypothetical protein